AGNQCASGAGITRLKARSIGNLRYKADISTNGRSLALVGAPVYLCSGNDDCLFGVGIEKGHGNGGAARDAGLSSTTKTAMCVSAGHPLRELFQAMVEHTFQRNL